MRRPLPSTPPPASGPLHTLQQVATFFGVKPRTVQSWRASGRLRVLHMSPRCVRVEQAEIERILKEARS